MARKSLIEPGSILPGPDTLSRVIARDRDQSGRQAPSAAQHSPGPEQHFVSPVENAEGTEQALLQDNNQADQSYDNMTNKLSANQTRNQTGNTADTQTNYQESIPQNEKENTPVSQVERKSARRKANPAVSQPGGQSEANSENHSVADMIRQRSVVPAAPEVLKTVTLKVSPSLDEKIERYCFENKMKKQQFWADAAALYFETVEAGEGE